MSLSAKDFKVILESPRTFDEIKLEMLTIKKGSLKLIKQIFIKHQDIIRKVSIIANEISEKKLSKLLSFLPNLEEIVLNVVLKKTSENPKQKLSHLHNLRKLQCNTQAVNIIFELSNDILGTLSLKHTLNEKPISLELLQGIFEKQRNIVDFSFNPENVSSFELPSLTRLELVDSEVSNLKPDILDLLEGQDELRSLSLGRFLSTEEFFTICSKETLQSLEIKVKNIDNIIIKLNFLINLQMLEIDLFDNYGDFAFIELPFLKELKLKVQGKPNLKELISLFPSHFPSLKQLTLSANLAIDDTQDLHNLLQNPNLIKLEVTVRSALKQQNHFFGNFHEKLKEAHFGHLCSQDAVNFLTESVPNLERLNATITDLESLRKILTACKKLTHLKLYSKNDLDMSSDEFITCLKENGKNLVYFQCGTDRTILDFDACQKTKEAFDDQFEIIDYKYMTLIMRNEKWN